MFSFLHYYFFVLTAIIIASASARPDTLQNINITIRIPDGMEFLGARYNAARGSSNYFLISNDEVDWNKALKVCQAEGARLVSIETKEKDTDLIGFLASKGHKAGWTAGNDIIENGNYLWATTDEAMGPYFNWRGGDAPNLADCGCVSITSKKEENCNECAGVYKWVEDICALEKKFICEL